jgi:hypothetical protein
MKDNVVILSGMVTKQKFIADILELVEKKRLDYMDAIVHYCEVNKIDIETAAALIKDSQKIKSKIQEEAEALNFLPKGAKLPV